MKLSLPHGELALPTFLPDATRGFVRAVDSRDVQDCGIQAVVMNTYHLMQNPGATAVQALGGLHKMSGWSKPIFTDSGGFQIYSLIRQNQQWGTITNKGAVFYPAESKSNTRKYHLSPEKSIQYQIGFGSDVLFCLDDCTHVDAPLATQKESVQRTIKWARRSKQEYNALIDKKGISPERRPLIYAVIQGGGSIQLRQDCAHELLDIGFDGFGYGGWPLDGQGILLVDMLAAVRELVPGQYPLHALGVASPENVLKCAQLGYVLFDGAMPTRDARHGRLYAFNLDPTSSPLNLQEEWFSYIYALDNKHIRAASPVSQFCDCLACQHYSLGYLHHLYKSDDSLALRLGTIHNLRFMAQLMKLLELQHT